MDILRIRALHAQKAIRISSSDESVHKILLNALEKLHLHVADWNLEPYIALRVCDLTSDTIVLEKLDVFGRCLETLALKNGIPKVLNTCLEYLEKNALDVEGLFRISGNMTGSFTGGASSIQSLRASLKINSDEIPEYTESHAVASVVKMFLRELPKPLLGFDLYDLLIHLVKGRNVQHFSWALDILDPLYWNVTKRLSLFFNEMVQHENKMTLQNIATVLGPNIMRPQNASTSSLIADTGAVNQVALFLISNAKILFENRIQASGLDSDYLGENHPFVILALAKASFSYYPMYEYSGEPVNGVIPLPEIQFEKDEYLFVLSWDISSVPGVFNQSTWYVVAKCESNEIGIVPSNYLMIVGTVLENESRKQIHQSMELWLGMRQDTEMSSSNFSPLSSEIQFPNSDENYPLTDQTPESGLKIPLKEPFSTDIDETNMNLQSTTSKELTQELELSTNGNDQLVTNSNVQKQEEKFQNHLQKSNSKTRLKNPIRPAPPPPMQDYPVSPTFEFFEDKDEEFKPMNPPSPPISISENIRISELLNTNTELLYQVDTLINKNLKLEKKVAELEALLLHYQSIEEKSVKNHPKLNNTENHELPVERVLLNPSITQQLQTDTQISKEHSTEVVEDRIVARHILQPVTSEVGSRAKVSMWKQWEVENLK